MREKKGKLRKSLVLLVFMTMFLSTLAAGMVTSDIDGERSSEGAVSLVLNYGFDFDEPIISEDVGFDTVKMPDTEPWNKGEGYPILPAKTVKILLPQGKGLDEVKVEGGTLHELEGEYDIKRGGRQVPIGMEMDMEKITGKKVELQEPFPDKLNSEPVVQTMRGYKVMITKLYPVQYDPSEGKLSYYEDMEIDVYLKDSSVSHLFRGLAKDEELLKNNIGIENPSTLDSYSEAPRSRTRVQNHVDPSLNYSMVILTSQSLNQSSGNHTWQDLRDYRTNNGISTTIKTIEWVNTTYTGTDTQTKIREFSRDVYANWGTDYLLLGGDGDGADVGGESGDNIIPARLMYVYYSPAPSYSRHIPADCYYGLLDGPFDYDQNGDYGEPGDGAGGGEVDLYPEVYVGRAPVDSETELSNFVRKTLAYDQSESYSLWKTLFVGEDLGWNVYAKEYMEEIRLGSNNYGYYTEGTPGYYDANTLYYADSTWQSSQLINKLNSGINFLNHLGHANNGYVMKLYRDDVTDLTNSEYFFAYSQGCYPGAFDNKNSGKDYESEDCIGEDFVCSDRAAFAVIMCSRYGWGNTSSSNGASQHYHRRFIDEIFGEDEWHLGAANMLSKAEEAPNINDKHQLMRWCYYETNLLGDPSSKLKKPVPDEHDLSVDYIDTQRRVYLGDSTFVNASIGNCGNNTETNINVNLAVNGVIENTTTVSSLNKFEAANVSFYWTPSQRGMCNVSVRVEQVPGENRTNDNEKSKKVDVDTPASILLVDDDGGSEWHPERYFKLALERNGYDYDYWDKMEFGKPDYNILKEYAIIIWFVDQYKWNIEQDERNDLMDYLDNGGNLFITGEALWYLWNFHNTTFASDYLHTPIIKHQTGVYVDGIPGDPITDGITDLWDDCPGYIVDPQPPAEPILEYQKDQAPAALKVDTGTYKVVCFEGRFFEDTQSYQGDKDLLMRRIIDWFESTEHEEDLTSGGPNDGWHFISSKVRPKDTSISDVLDSIDGSYDKVIAHQNPYVKLNGSDIWSDDFEDGTVSPWTVSGCGYAEVTTNTSNSGSNALQVGSWGVTVTSPVINLSGYNLADLSLWIRRGHNDFSDQPGPGDDLSIEYRDENGLWNTLETFPGRETPGEIFTPSYELPLKAMHEDFRVRVKYENLPYVHPDNWHVDDVRLIEKSYEHSDDIRQWVSYVPGRSPRYNTLDTYDSSMGIWVHMTSNDTLSIPGYRGPPVDLTLKPGWNMVGYPSNTTGNNFLPAEVDKVGYFDSSNPYNLEYDFDPGNFSFTPGQGYWVHNPTDRPIIWKMDW